MSKREPFFARKLREHFGLEPLELPILSAKFEPYDHVNLQVALDTWLAAPGRRAEILGIPMAFFEVNIADLLTAPRPGPVQYTQETLGEGELMTCISQGLMLLHENTMPLAALITQERRSIRDKVKLEVMAPSREDGERFLEEIRTNMRTHNVYRGRLISLKGDLDGLKVQFQRLPRISREQIILPEGLLERIERHTLGFARHSKHLLATGRHLKRGLLLYGKPGTGKTLTVMYLASAMEDRTVFLVTGMGQGLIEEVCKMARALAPATIVIEDVDLIAQDREQFCSHPLLFELLNQMDGLAEDTDILFILTTNRPEVLESALAARPGRIDQAIEIPLPDARCRRRLFELYSQGLEIQRADWEAFIPRTEGASPAFIRELLRTAALFAAEAGHPSQVKRADLEEAFRELVVRGGLLTRRILGFHMDGGAPSD